MGEGRREAGKMSGERNEIRHVEVKGRKGTELTGRQVGR